MFSWINLIAQWIFGRQDAKTLRPRNKSPRRPFRPSAEQLEHRLALATTATYNPTLQTLTFTDNGAGPTTVTLISNPGSNQVRFSATDLVDPTPAPVTKLSITNAGSGYTNGFYQNVPLNGGTGSGVLADINIVAGKIDTVTVSAGGNGNNYHLNDVLTAPASSLGGGTPTTTFSLSVNEVDSYLEHVSGNIYQTRISAVVADVIVDLGTGVSNLVTASTWNFSVPTTYIGTADIENLDISAASPQFIFVDNLGANGGVNGEVLSNLLFFSDIDNVVLAPSATLQIDLNPGIPLNADYIVTGPGKATFNFKDPAQANQIVNTFNFEGLNSSFSNPVFASVAELQSLTVSQTGVNYTTTVSGTDSNAPDNAFISFSNLTAPDLNLFVLPTDGLTILGNALTNDVVNVGALQANIAVDIADPGSGYQIGDAIYIETGIGALAAIEIIVDDIHPGGGVKEAHVSYRGSFASAPSNPLADPGPRPPGETAASFTVTYGFVEMLLPALTIDGQGGSDSVTINSDLLLGQASTNGDLQVSANSITLNDATIDATAGTNPGSVTLTGATVLGTDVTINAGVLGGNVTFDGTLNATNAGTQDLTLTARDIFFNGVVGSTRLGDITISNAEDVHALASVTAASLTQSIGSGTARFDGLINTNTATGVQLTGNILEVNDSITTTNNGVVTVNQTVSATFDTDADITSAGAVDLTAANIITGGNIKTTQPGANVTFHSATRLTDSIEIDTSAGSSNITFQNTLNGTAGGGAEALKLTAGGGNIRFQAAVGQTERLGAITIDSANNVDVDATASIRAASFVEGTATVAGTGTTTIDGPVTVNGIIGINIKTKDLLVKKSLTTEPGSLGIVNVDVGNRAEFTSTGDISADGDVTVKAAVAAADAIKTAGDITTANANVTFVSPATLTGTISVNTGSGAGNILFSSTLNAATSNTEGINLTGGAGNVTFSAPVGTVLVPLGPINIASAFDVTAVTITTHSLTQVTGTGTTTLNGPVLATQSGVSLTSKNVTVNAGITTQNAAGVTVNAVNGTATFVPSGPTSADGAISSDGAVSVTASGSGGIVTGVDFTSTDDNITFNSPIRLTHAGISVNSGPTIGDIAFNSTIEGTVAGSQPLSLTAGTGNITITGGVGQTTRLGAVTIVSANDVTAAAIRASNLKQTNGSGLTKLNGAVNTNVGGIGGGVSLNGKNLEVNNSITTTVGSGGTVTVTETGTATFATNGNIISDGAVSLAATLGISTAGDVSTTDDDVTYLSATTLTDTGISVTTDTGAGDIVFASTVKGTAANAQSLTLAAGGGSITLSDAVGTNAIPLGPVDIALPGAHNVHAFSSITASRLTQAAGTGTTTLDGIVTTNTAQGVNLKGMHLAVNDEIHSNGGLVTFDEDGTATIAAAGDIFADSDVNVTADGGISTAGNVTTSNDSVSFISATKLTGDITIDTNTLAGNISFGSTLNGTTDGVEDLTLKAGTGDISFASAVGATKRLGIIDIQNAKDVGAAAITAAHLLQQAGTGTTTLGGAVNTDTAAGVNLKGTNLVVNAGITTIPTSNGVVIIDESGAATFAAAGNINADGPVSIKATGAGNITTAGDVFTSNDDITFVSPTRLSDDVKVSSGAGGGNILYSSTLTGSADNSEDLELTAGTGNITFTGAVGATRLGAILISSAFNVLGSSTIAAGSVKQDGAAPNGTTTFNGAVNTNTPAGVNLNGYHLAVNDGITTSTGGVVTVIEAGTATFAPLGDIIAAGPVSITATGGISTAGDVSTSSANVSYLSPTTLTGNIAVTTSTGEGDILFASTLKATTGGALAETLMLTAGDGDINFNNTVGNPTRLGALTIVSAENVTAANTVTARSILQQAGSGTTTFNGAVNTDTADGVKLLNGKNLAVNAGITTTNDGVVTVVESGTAIFSADGDIVADGAVSLSATGGISTAANVTTTADNVTYVSPTQLTGPVVITTGSGLTIGDITFNSTLNGTQTLELTAGIGNIKFNGAAGGIAPLAAVTIYEANNVDVTSSGSIAAASLTQADGSGTTTFEGAVSTTGAGVALNGTNLVSKALITTTGGGLVTVTESGTVIFDSSGNINSDGAVSLTANGSGGISTAGDITTSADKVTYASPTTLTGLVVVNTGAAGGDILFSNTVKSDATARNLILTAGTGNIDFDAAVGGGSALNELTINSAQHVTFDSTVNTAGAITQSLSTGTTTFSGIATAGASSSIANKNIVLTTGTGKLNVTGAVTLSADDNITLNIGTRLFATGAATLNFGNTNGDAVTLSGEFDVGTAAINGTNNRSNTLKINYQTATLSVTTGGVVFTGGTGAVTNQIIANGTTASDTFTVSNATLTKTGHSNVNHFNTQQITLNAGDGDDTITISGGGSALTTVNGEVGNDTLKFEGGLNIVANGDGGTGGAGTDHFQVNSATGANLFGNDGNDDFNVNATLTGSIDAGLNDDTIFLNNSGSVTGTINGSSGVDKLSYANLTTQPATVTVSASGTIDGYRGTGTGMSGSAPTFDNINDIIGNAGAVITGISTSNVWIIEGPNFGTLNGVPFSGLTTLTGGAGVDIFRTAPGYNGVFNGTIDGGAGNDIIDFSSHDSASGKSYTINALNAGTVSGGTIFVSVENIQAGAGSDLFELVSSTGVSAAIAGTLNGGGGTDTLKYTNRTSGVQVDLALGTASSTGGIARVAGIATIENVVGTNFDDIIFGDAGNNILAGGVGGNDILVGQAGDDTLKSNRTGRNILIGGLGANTLLSGAADPSGTYGPLAGDLMIGESTIYDNNKTALSAILLEWSRNATYTTRVNRIRGLASGGLNGSYRLTTSTVIHSTTASTIDGGTNPLLDANWYVAAFLTDISSFRSGETRTII